MTDARLSSFLDLFESDDLDIGLPPMLSAGRDGRKVWTQINQQDFDLMGYLLSCHLLIEHYMDEFLKAHHPNLNWDSAKMNFAQRADLLTKWGTKEGDPIDPVPTIKHFNSLRNRFGHKLNYKLSSDDTLPFVQYMQKIAGGAQLEGASPKEVLHLATWCCCSTLVLAIGKVIRKTQAQQKPTGGAAQ